MEERLVSLIGDEDGTRDTVSSAYWIVHWFCLIYFQSSSSTNFLILAELKFWSCPFIVPQFGAVYSGSFKAIKRHPLKKQCSYFYPSLASVSTTQSKAGFCFTNNNKTEFWGLIQTLFVPSLSLSPCQQALRCRLKIDRRSWAYLM